MGTKKCECSNLMVVRDENGSILGLECVKCERTWEYNSILGYWSDSYIGTFVKKKLPLSEKEEKQ